jgi:hypothetical protein
LVIAMVRLQCQSAPSLASEVLCGRAAAIAALAINNPKVRTAIVLMRMTEPRCLITPAMLANDCLRSIA